ncbi:MAG: hypothetical protein H6Q17_535 [Bacteroidetes bacterium]|nr:hypothetical protein [Bacteroidota bacterium]
MGQISEDIQDGSCCSLCGQYFQYPKTDGIYVHGHPVVCWDCWKDLNKKDRRIYKRADVKTI